VLLFCIPGGVGIPPGVLLGRGDGLGALFMTVLYFASDVVLAAFFEPVLQVLAFVSRRVPAVERANASHRAIRDDAGKDLAGPTGVALPASARACRSAVPRIGNELRARPRWLLTISATCSTSSRHGLDALVQGLLGDPRMAALAALVVMLVVPLALRRFRPTG
jgi:hypothetical protein